MEMSEYNRILEEAYDPNIKIKDKLILKNKLLKYKSVTINHRGGCPKKVEDAIEHISKEGIKPSKDGINIWQKFLHLLASSILIAIIREIMSRFL